MLRITSLVGGLGQWKGAGKPKRRTPRHQRRTGKPKRRTPRQDWETQKRTPIPTAFSPTQPVHHGSCRCMFSPHATSLQTSLNAVRDTRNNKRQKYELSLFSMTWAMTKTTSKNLDLHCFSSICGMTTSKVQNCLHCFFSLCGIAGP